MPSLLYSASVWPLARRMAEESEAAKLTQRCQALVSVVMWWVGHWGVVTWSAPFSGEFSHQGSCYLVFPLSGGGCHLGLLKYSHTCKYALSCLCPGTANTRSAC